MTDKYEKLLSFDEVIMNIRDALDGMDGDEVSEANNDISSNEIEYVGDSTWRYKIKENEE